MPLMPVAQLTPAASSELDYVERTTNLTVTATADGNGNGDVFIQGNAHTYDGATRILLTFYCPIADVTQNQNIVVNLYDFTTDLGRLANVESTGGEILSPVSVSRIFTPPAGSHTYRINVWKTGGTATLFGGAGGASTYMPAYYRIVTA